MAKQLKKKLTTNTNTNTVISKSDQSKSSNELINNKGIYTIFILVSAIKFILIPT